MSDRERIDKLTLQFIGLQAALTTVVRRLSPEEREAALNEAREVLDAVDTTNRSMRVIKGLDEARAVINVVFAATHGKGPKGGI